MRNPALTTPRVPMRDADYLAAVLADGKWHTWQEIMSRSQADRGHGMTIHSRAAQLRRRLAPEGKTIECKTGRRDGRGFSSYRLVSLDDVTDTSSADLTPRAPLPLSVASSSEPGPNPCGSSDGTDEQMHGVRDDTGSLQLDLFAGAFA